MNTFAAPLHRSWCVIERGIAALQPAGALAARLYIAQVFWLAGLTKIRDWETTLLLFTEEYRVPLLPPAWAAVSGTAGELLLPVLLVLGLGGRLAALGLSVVNAVAAISLPDIAPAAWQQHLTWGALLAALVLSGPGRWSVDRLWASMRGHRRPPADSAAGAPRTRGRFRPRPTQLPARVVRGLVHVPHHRPFPQRQAGAVQAVTGLLRHRRGAPGHTFKHPWRRRAQAQQHITAVFRRQQGGVVRLQRIGHRLQVLRGQRRAVGPEQDQRHAAVRKVVLHGSGQSLPQIAAGLRPQRHAVHPAPGLEMAVRLVRGTPQRERPDGGRAHREQGLAQQGALRACGAGGTEQRREPGLGQPGHRRLGQHRHRGSGARPVAVTPRQLGRVCTQRPGGAQPPHQHDGAPQAVTVPASAGGLHPFAQAGRRCDAAQTTAQVQVLHQGQRGKPAGGQEQAPLHEQGLVAGGQTTPARPHIHERGHHGQQAVTPLDTHIEAAPAGAGGHRLQDGAVGLRRQGGVGVQEQQHAPPRGIGAGVHLRRAAARCPQDPVGPGHGQRGCAILAAAVDHDHLGAPLAKRGQRLQPRDQRGGFVQHRHDDAQTGHGVRGERWGRGGCGGCGGCGRLIGHRASCSCVV